MSDAASNHQPSPRRSRSKRPSAADIAHHLGAAEHSPAAAATALGVTLAELALRAGDARAQAAIEALHALYSACADLSVARTRAEAARQLEQLVRDATTQDATPEQSRRLLIDVLKLAGQRLRKRAAESDSASEPAADLSTLPADVQEALRATMGSLGEAAPQNPEESDDEQG